MNIFDILIVQPIFNALLFIYGIVPGRDFGVSIIIFTVLIRLALWPLIKKQLHQTKLMRRVQPELKKIKARTKGNKQLQTQLMMELYKENGVKPFSSIGILLIQLPIFIALYYVMIIITQQRERIDLFLYEPIKNIPAVGELVSNPKAAENLFGFVDLASTALQGGQLYFPVLILALLASIFQYIQTKQILPKNDSKKKLKDILKESSSGKQVDQAEIMTIMSSRMALFLPLLLFVFAFYLPGAVILYYAVSSIVAVIQQHIILSKDEEELLELAEQPVKADDKTVVAKNRDLKVRIKKAKKAHTVSAKKSKKRR